MPDRYFCFYNTITTVQKNDSALKATAVATFVPIYILKMLYYMVVMFDLVSLV